MSHDVRAMLEGQASPELVDALADLVEVLERHNGPDVLDELDYYSTVEDALDPSTLATSVTYIVRLAADGVLHRRGIDVTDTMALDRLATLVRYVLEYGPSDDDQAREDILESGQAPDEMLMDLLGLAGPYPTEDYLSDILHVDYRLIREFRALLREGREEALSDQARALLESLNQYHLAHPESLSGIALQSGVVPGTAMESIYLHYKPTLMARAPAAAVVDLVGLVLLSGVGMEALQDEVDFYLDELYPSLEARHTATQLLTRHLQDLNHGQA